LANPPDDSANGIEGEWVEIYNKGDTEVDLNDWYIEDKDSNHTITIADSNTYNGSTVIGAKGWLVVFMNDSVLNNTGDIVKLFNKEDKKVDSYDYTDISGSVPENKSYVRYPDGSKDWYDPVPTPGGANILDNPPKGVSVKFNNSSFVIDKEGKENQDSQDDNTGHSEPEAKNPGDNDDSVNNTGSSVAGGQASSDAQDGNKEDAQDDKEDDDKEEGGQQNNNSNSTDKNQKKNRKENSDVKESEENEDSSDKDKKGEKENEEGNNDKDKNENDDESSNENK
jgi:hypothetical protein